MGGLTTDGLNIVSILKFPKLFGIRIDNGDIAGLFDQVLS
jgi:hypothetical protein